MGKDVDPFETRPTEVKVVVQVSLFGMRLKKRREHMQLTQAKLAEAIGLTASSTNSMEAQGSKPSLDTLMKLARVLKTSPNYLLGFGTDPLQAPEVREFLVKLLMERDSLTREDAEREADHALKNDDAPAGD